MDITIFVFILVAIIFLIEAKSYSDTRFFLKQIDILTSKIMSRDFTAFVHGKVAEAEAKKIIEGVSSPSENVAEETFERF